MQKKRVIFMGTPEYAEKILKALSQNSKYMIPMVFTQPDKPVGRKKILTPPPVKVYANEMGFKVLQPGNLRSDETATLIKDAKPDFIVVAAYGQILPKDILEIAPCINLHASILPQYRGASPVQQVLLEGRDYTGVTAMLMNEGLDTGDILAYTKRYIPTDMRLVELMDILAKDASELIIDVLDRFDEIEPLSQVGAVSSHCKKIGREDGKVSLDSAVDIYNKFRAFENWPGVFLSNGLKLTKISINETDSINEEAGVILSMDKKGFTLSCKRGSLKIYRVHPASKKETEAKAYLAGKRLKIGDNIL